MYSHRGDPEDLAAGLAACSEKACKTSLRRRQQKNASRLARKREGYQAQRAEGREELAKARDRAAASEAVVATLMAAVAAATTDDAGAATGEAALALAADEAPAQLPPPFVAAAAFLAAARAALRERGVLHAARTKAFQRGLGLSHFDEPFNEQLAWAAPLAYLAHLAHGT